VTDPVERNTSHSRSTLGVVAICFNEAADLPGFLESVTGWADEIVLIDDGSTDETATLARAAGATVKFLESPRAEGEFFSDQRNKGIAAASSDWLLHMDIDERVTPAFKAEVDRAIQSSGYDAYRFRRLNFFLHRPMRGGGWQSWNQVHLARRSVLRFSGMYHEQCEVDAAPGRVGQLKQRMWHLNDDGYLERMRKSDLYCQEEAHDLERRGVSVHWWHMLLLPIREFLRTWVWRLGFRDGVPGLLFAAHAATAKFRACALLWDRQNTRSRASLEDRAKHDETSESP